MDDVITLTDAETVALCKAGVKMETSILDTEVVYTVVIGNDDDTAWEDVARVLWHRRVPFGDDDAHCAGGAAFRNAVRRQEEIAWACAHAGQREEIPEIIRSLRAPSRGKEAT